MREKLEALKDHAHSGAHGAELALVARQRGALELDVSAFDRLQTVGAAKQRGFSRARGPDQTDDFSCMDVEIDA